MNARFTLLLAAILCSLSFASCTSATANPYITCYC